MYISGMPDLHFEWDARKAAENLRKHGVSFEEARTAFEDERALVIDDPDHSADEDRFVLLGMTRWPRLVVVIHCYRERESIIRLISARRATRTEARGYMERRP
jgi:uncharacterized DUF497 family protein